MLIAKTIFEVRNFVKKFPDKKIALVPTMGALHCGHLALVKKACELAEIVVVSIFVNRTQFNDLSDYEKYPRQVERDIGFLRDSGTACVFIPDENEMFAHDFSFKIFPTRLTDCLCGAMRPAHFDGVALIVSKLFNIVKPDFAIFGEKDFQQLLIIKRLVRDLNFGTEIISCEILREKSGLAMSSRNQRLSDAHKIMAANIFRILSEIKCDRDPKILSQKQRELLEIGFEKIDYLEIRDEENLNLITDYNCQIPARIFIAVYLGGVRLIDNLHIDL